MDAHAASHRADAGAISCGRTGTLVQHAAGCDRAEGGGRENTPAQSGVRRAERHQRAHRARTGSRRAVQGSLRARRRGREIPHGLDRSRGPRSDVGEACRLAWGRCGVHSPDAVGAGRHRTPRARPGGSSGQGTHGDHRRRYDAGSAHPVEEGSSRARVPLSGHASADDRGGVSGCTGAVRRRSRILR